MKNPHKTWLVLSSFFQSYFLISLNFSFPLIQERGQIPLNNQLDHLSHYKKNTMDCFVANPLQTHENPLQISFSNGFATEQFCCKLLQKTLFQLCTHWQLVAKNNEFATELLCCYVATDFTYVSNFVAKSQQEKRH